MIAAAWIGVPVLAILAALGGLLCYLFGLDVADRRHDEAVARQYEPDDSSRHREVAGAADVWESGAAPDTRRRCPDCGRSMEYLIAHYCPRRSA